MKRVMFGRKLLAAVVVFSLLLTSAFVLPVYADGEPPVSGTVTYDANGGKGTAVKQNVAVGTPLAFPAVSRAGYTLNGWYTAKTGGTKVTTATKVTFASGTTAVSYYAQWKGNKIKVTYSLASGKLKSGAKKYVYTYVGAKYGKLATPTRSGYKFLGWYTGSTKVTKDSIVTKTAAHKITAKWLKKGTGKTITSAEYKRLTKGISRANAKYTVGGLGASENLGSGLYLYGWDSATSSKKAALAIFYNDKLVWKAQGTENQLLKKAEDWMYGAGYEYILAAAGI